MLVSTLLVMLVSANADADVVRKACTDPLLSYTYDSATAGDHTMITCLVCADTATWHIADADGDKRTMSEKITNIASLQRAIDQVPEGNVTEALGGGENAPTVFYWAHPKQGSKFLLQAQQGEQRWSNDSAYAAPLVETLDYFCSFPGNGA